MCPAQDIFKETPSTSCSDEPAPLLCPGRLPVTAIDVRDSSTILQNFTFPWPVNQTARYVLP